MAKLRPPLLEIVHDEEDAEFLFQLEAAEAEALSLWSSSKRRRVTLTSSSSPATDLTAIKVKSERDRENAREEVKEGAYTAALRGSKSLTWQKQKESDVIGKCNKPELAPPRVVGGACYKCGKEGHWSKDCTDQSSVEKCCPCGSGSCLVFTANTERNRGRKFFRCPLRQENGGCGFFEWCDESSKNCTSDGEKAWKNVGQQQCHQRHAYQGTSGFHDFDDKGAKSLSSGFGDFQKFEATDNKGYGTKTSSSCFKCGKEGHWARDCQVPPPSSNLTSSNLNEYNRGTNYLSSGRGAFQKIEVTDNKGYSTKTGSSCFKCGKEGHWARDCPAPPSANLTPSSTGLKRKSSSSTTCYKCGQSGHWTKDCSQTNY